MITGREEWVEIPHEPGNELRLRTLSWAEIKEARTGRQREAMSSMREMGAEIMQALPKSQPGDSILNAALGDPLDEYSLDVLLRSGVVDWRGAEYVEAFDVSKLDPTTAEWAARTVYSRSRIEGADAGKSRGNSAPTTAGEAVTDTRSG